MTVKHMPKSGSFVAWKKVWVCVGISKYTDHERFLYQAILKLRIPARAKRVMCRYDNLFRKCRAERAFVEGVYSNTSGRKIKLPKNHKLRSCWDPRFAYEIGKKVEPVSYDPSEYEICTPGIHFFMTKREAQSYQF